MSKRCEPAARAPHGATFGFRSAYGPGSGTRQTRSPDPYRKRAAEPDRRSGGIGRGLRLVAHDAYAGVSACEEHASRGNSLAAGIGIRASGVHFYRHHFWIGARMAVTP